MLALFAEAPLGVWSFTLIVLAKYKGDIYLSKVDKGPCYLAIVLDKAAIKIVEP